MTNRPVRDSMVTRLLVLFSTSSCASQRTRFCDLLVSKWSYGGLFLRLDEHRNFRAHFSDPILDTRF
jgi:hypothetical protein